MLKDKLLAAHHTAICVNDFERARDFYTGFLGFELEGEMDHRSEPAMAEVVGLPGATVRWAMLRHDGYRVELFKYYTPDGDKQARRQCDFGYSHMAFEVEDVDAVYEQATRAGYETVSSPCVMRKGRTKVFYLMEPEGAITEFIQFMNPAA
ncbi:VOC family protein [Achromobacter anxifer]|uniref:VOC family protein n=1 Tax=Achromobacter anxifer TaxID=1287737 RepID=UPI0023F79B8F|nr:VOC family protein [Achromobacter anxifer]MDF8364029.1 VOC family protein [Achromobacter anxifer]